MTSMRFKNGASICRAVADVPSLNQARGYGDNVDPDGRVLVAPSSEEDITGERSIADYDWMEEWYPRYLALDITEDAPLGLAVFDKQLVLYRDGYRVAMSRGQLLPLVGQTLGRAFSRLEVGMLVPLLAIRGQRELPADAKIPRSTCVRTYEMKDSQGVIWVWMSQENPPNFSKIPWFENFTRPGFQDVSTIHELPYDHSILLDNPMDPAHIPISHDRTDWAAKKEDAQPLCVEVTERTDRGFAGWWGKEREGSLRNFLRYEAPCVLQNNRELVDKDGQKHYFAGLFLCQATGQGKSMLVVRFGGTRSFPLAKLFPKWNLHQNGSKVFQQDMRFLSSQNKVLKREKVPTKHLQTRGWLSIESGWTKLAMECPTILDTTLFRCPNNRDGHGLENSATPITPLRME